MTHLHAVPLTLLAAAVAACGGGEPRLGGGCAADGDCATGLCLLPAGVCSEACASEATCGGGFSCQLRPGEGGTASGFCLEELEGAVTGQPCSTDGDCRTGLCQLGACAELCAAEADCPNEAPTCAATQHVLGELAPAASLCMPASGELVWDVGPVTIGTQLLVPIPPHAASFAAVASIDSTSLFAGELDLHDPDGNLLYALNSQDVFANPIRYLPDAQISTMLVPNTPSVELVPGVYTLAPISIDPNTGAGGPDPLVSIRTKLGDPRATTLDLNLFFLDLSGHPCVSGRLDAQTARDGAFDQVLAIVNTIYDQAELKLGEVTFADLDRPELDAVDPETELGPLFATTGDQAGAAVNVFFVRTISGGGGGFEILGIAGGIPGPPAIHGTIHSGVAVSMNAACNGGDGQIALTIAHEVGHYLGLFHSLESDGRTTDAIADSAGQDNLMFFAETGSIRLSAGQGFVMRRNPVTQP